MTDVTAEVEAAVPAGADDLARFRAIERKQKEMVAACEKAEHHRCQVAAFDGGLRYVLIDSLEFPDVRLVYAPPGAVGDYGGEIDNWSWPRHVGDFALLRVYAGPDGQPAPKGEANVAYRPRHFFPVSRRGVEPDSFVMVAGYPGLTFRSLHRGRDARAGGALLPAPRRALPRLDRQDGGGLEADEAVRIALADRIKGLANQEKNSRGQVAGIRRGQILEKKAAAEKEILAWAAKHPEQREAVAAHDELARLIAERRRTWERDFLLTQMKSGPKPLDLALTLARWAGEKAKPDLEREPEYQERNRERLGERLERDQKRLDAPTDAALLADVFARFAALPEGTACRRSRAFSARRPRGDPRPGVDDLLARTKVTDLAERKRMFDETEEQLRARHDPLLDLAFALDRELRALKEQDDRFQGAVSRLRPRWQRAVIAHAGKPVAPDANGTLRVAFAHVKGYSPRDGAWMRAADDGRRRGREEHRRAPLQRARRAAGGGAQGPREPLGGPEAEGRAGRLPRRRRHHRRQLGEPGGQRPRRAGGGQFRSRLGERGQRLRLQPGRGAQHQRRRALPALADAGPPRRRGHAAAGGDGGGREEEAVNRKQGT